MNPGGKVTGMPTITVSAIVVRNDDASILTVRKRNTAKFMFPGGKPEPGETALECALREFHEELGVSLSADDLTFLGVYHTDAANEPGHQLIAHVYELTGPAAITDIHPCAEIAEHAWLSSHDARCAPLVGAVLID